MNYLLVDGNYLTTYLWFRQKSGGQGFWLEMLNIAEHFDTDVIGIAFDCNGTQMRRTIYPEYKLAREKNVNPVFEEWKAQKNLVYKNILTSLQFLPVHFGKVESLEADDLLWHWTQLLKEDQVVILTGDKDLYQCCFQKDNVRVYHPKDGSIIDREKVRNDFGTVEGMILQKAIVGDNSDNVVGVKGIGWKRAKTLWDIHEGNLYDIVYSDSDFETTDKNLIKVIESREIVRRNLKLMRLGDLFTDELSRQSEQVLFSQITYDPRATRHFAAASGWKFVIQKWERIHQILNKLPL